MKLGFRPLYHLSALPLVGIKLKSNTKIHYEINGLCYWTLKKKKLSKQKQENFKICVNSDKKKMHRKIIELQQQNDKIL